MKEDEIKRESEGKTREKQTLESMESKIEAMERRIKELEKSLGEKTEVTKNSDESLVGDLVSSFIPGFGKIVKTLEKTSPEFRQRIAETDSEIKHRLETGWSEKKPSISYGVSIRPLSAGSRSTRIPKGDTSEKKAKEVKIESTKIEPVFDVFEEDDYISVIAEIPGASEEDIYIEIKGNKLNISAGTYSKLIILPSEAETITERSFNNNVLQLKIKRKEKFIKIS